MEETQGSFIRRNTNGAFLKRWYDCSFPLPIVKYSPMDERAVVPYD